MADTLISLNNCAKDSQALVHALSIENHFTRARRTREMLPSDCKEHHHTLLSPNHAALAKMSSIVDGLLTSDNPDLDLAAGARKNGAPKMSNGRSRSSMPPSESNGALSDVEGFPDDEVVGVRGTDRNRPRDPMARAVPKVVDRVGEKVAEEFESFLEQCVASTARETEHS